MRFKGLDLNLLVALDALLEERSVTAAAARMHLSQPAMSSALGRLRRYLGDEILVPFGKRMMPTAHAEQLHRSVRALLLQVEQVVSLSTVFEPAVTRRQFRIGASDYIIEVLIGPLIRHLANVAPGLEIAVVSPSVAMGQSLLRGEIDCIITPRPYLFDGHPFELLFEDRHVLVGWSGNPLMAAPVTQDQFYAAGHVVAEFGADRVPAFAERQMTDLVRSRRIEVVLPSFTSVATALIGTNRLALMHERLAIAQSRYLPLSYGPIPFEFPRFEEMLLINDWSLRRIAPIDVKTGFGWIQAKPASSMAPVTVTPNELGPTWSDGRIHAVLAVDRDGEPFGRAHGGAMEFGFHDLIAHAAATRDLCAGTIIGSGTVSNETYREVGSSCISKRRAIELVAHGAPRTPFMRFGETVRMEMLGPNGRSVFGAIQQRVVVNRANVLS